MSSWKKVKLKDICSKIGSGSTPRGGNNVYLHSGIISLIRSQNIHNHGFIADGLVYIDQEKADKLKNVIVEENDVLINITGDSVARVALVDKMYLPARVNQHVAILRAVPEILDHRYLKYYLVNLPTQQHLLTLASSGATRNALTKSMLENLEILLPNINDQRRIADSLEILDNKIQLNTQTNQTLEQIAQAIFKSWFVDFDPVKAKIDAITNGGTHADAERAAMQVISGKTNAELTQMQQTNPDAYKTLEKTAALFPSEMVESELGDVPKGWGIGCIGDIATAKGGYAFKSSQFEQKGNPVIKIKNITSTGNIILEDCQCINDLVANVASKFKLSDGDFLMAMTGATVGKIGIYVSDGRCAFVNQRVAKFESKLFKNIPCWYTYNLIRRSDVSEKIIGSAQGSAQANISSSGIEQVAIMLPIRDLIYLYQSTVSHLYEKWIANHKELLKLKMTRDTLLPKLLSGELNN
ncbi:restriction endonuclease subunit S [Bisgaard Taxon 45]|uniref:Restriction endonuclease subunit S n=1 Tax=Bisgaard Taxon 45 TaxID=304289 RepID=A0ABT9KDL8_9PAST|nr:restriction endonuclease subunit S [Bisgaard Taxon 45]